MSSQPKSLQGLRVPLFDRLVDSAPEVQQELTPLRLYGREALFASIARDLQRLLNARRANSQPLAPAEATVLDYGIPDFTHLSPSSEIDQRALAETIRQAIQIFEPRLQAVSVTFTPDPANSRQLLGFIACKARLGTHLEPVSFPLILQNRQGEVQILAPHLEAQPPARLTPPPEPLRG